MHVLYNMDVCKPYLHTRHVYTFPFHASFSFSLPIAHACFAFKLPQVLGCSRNGHGAHLWFSQPAYPWALLSSDTASNLSGAGLSTLLELPHPSCRHVARSVPASSQPCLVLLPFHPLPSWPQAECGMRQKRDLARSQADLAFLCELEMLLELCEPWTPGLEVKVNIWSLQGCHAHQLHAGLKSVVWSVQASVSVAHASGLSCLWLSTQLVTKVSLLPSLLLWTGTVPATTCTLSALRAEYEFQVAESPPSFLLKCPHLDIRPSPQSNLPLSSTDSAPFVSDEIVTNLFCLNYECPPQISLFTLCPWLLSPFGFHASKFQGFLTSTSGGNHKREGQGGSMGRKSTVN